MKKQLFFWSLLAIAINFISCSNHNDEPEIVICTGENFRFDENGRCYLPNNPPISFTEFLKYTEGNGWKHVSTHEINPNGTIQKEDYYQDLIGAGPSHLYFERENYTTYAYIDAYPAKAYYITPYTYVENGNFIGNIPEGTNEFHTEFQILSIDENNLQVIEYMGLRGYQDKLVKLYGLVTYKKMTDAELKDYQENYINIEELRK